MKKILITILVSFLFLSSSFAYNLTSEETKLLNKFETKLQEIDKYNLEEINEKLFYLKQMNKNSWKATFLLSQIQKSLDNEIEKKGKISYNHYDFILDFSDYKNVLWFSHNVFVAKVIKNNWTKSDENDDLSTDFEVEVLYNIKWNLNWKINTVFQGWYDENNILILWHWTRFLEEWNVYLLVTMWDIHKISAHENWITLISSSKNKLDIKNIIQNNKKISEFRKSYINENNFNTPNSYKSLTENEKQNFDIFDNWFSEK
jgi:hypothetical protein